MQNGPDNPNFPDRLPNPAPHGVRLPNEEIANEVNDAYLDEDVSTTKEQKKVKRDPSEDEVKFNLDKVDDLEESKHSEDK
ncbi:hypothetical protein [Marinilactibacillus kalidii]|uniref:hypothetical protein n=1 Tax=Marinilactibacillus kalidii TaxID=2820274 RepID=UPI001ABDA4F6|nr:hypothetical protein [Marinilactibacillus kalidii]